MSADRIFLNRAARNVEESPAYKPISKIRIIVGEDQDGNAIAYDAGSTSGRTLEIENPFGTQQMANDLLQTLQGYAYKPYMADGAILDPAAEIGDAVSVGDVYSVIAEAETTFSPIMSANIGAREDSNIDHEYPYETPQERALARIGSAMGVIKSALSVEDGKIEAITEQIGSVDEEGSIINRLTSLTETVNGIHIYTNREIKTLARSEIDEWADVNITPESITSLVSSTNTFATKEDYQASLDYADGVAETLTEDYTSKIEQTARSIESTVASSIDRWDTSALPSGRTIIRDYGEVTNGDYPPAAHSGSYYVDQETGRYWYSTGYRWVLQGNLEKTTDTLDTKIEQTNTQITLVAAATNLEFENVYSQISVTADQIRAEVSGNTAAEWSVYGSDNSGNYYAGDVVKVTSEDADGNFLGVTYYQCTADHVAWSYRKPGSGEDWQDYWVQTNAPTVQSLIDASLDGITLGYSDSALPNSAVITINRNGIQLDAATITMSNVQVNTLAAGISITSPDIYGGNFMDTGGAAALSFSSISGNPGGGNLYYGPTGVLRASYNAYFFVSGVGNAVTPYAVMYLGGRELGRVQEGTGGFVASGTWDFSGATVILPS